MHALNLGQMGTPACARHPDLSNQMINRRIDLTTAVLLLLVTVLVALDDWSIPGAAALIPWVIVPIGGLLALRVSWSRQLFFLAGVVLTVLLAAFVPDWQPFVQKGLRSAAFIAAFYTALSTLRNVTSTAPSIADCGNFLAAQPPGRRYVALTAGGQLFALVLNYGAISLLGSLATASARSERDPEIRAHRTRRMLLAIQRGFVASLPWSPLAFAMAITNAVIPGASWADSVIPGLGSMVVIAVTGWALDTIFKPRLSAPAPPRRPVEGSWARLSPLFILLAVIGTSVFTLHEAMGISVAGVVIVVVPTVSIGWALLQHFGDHDSIRIGHRAYDYLTRDLPSNWGAITLLVMAGYIGTVGAPLLAPLIASAGLDPSGLPVWVILVFLVWVIPVMGQIGMNPILAVTLIAPLIPDPAVLGIPPAVIVTAIGAGWALGGISSPFTATTLLVGSFGGVSAQHVGLRWNAGYIPVAGGLLTVWVLIYAVWAGGAAV